MNKPKDTTMKAMVGLLTVVMMSGILSMMLVKPVSASTQGTIVINTIPSGASVSIGGILAGTSPLTINVSPGTYTILIQLSGYNDATTSVTITGGDTHTLNASLTQVGSGWISIDIGWGP